MRTEEPPLRGKKKKKEGNEMTKLFKSFLRDEEGAALVEYGLLVGLIALVCITAVTNLGSTVKTLFTNIASSL